MKTLKDLVGQDTGGKINFWDNNLNWKFKS